MINTKIIYNTLLEEEAITSLVDSDYIFDAYPSTIEDFPCVCFVETKQTDIEYSDNTHNFEKCNVEIHIFTKALEDYPSTSEIGIAIANVFNREFWAMQDSKEVADPVEDVRHRIMSFSKDIYLC